MMILTLSIVLTSVAISLLIGIPVGILTAYSRLTEAVMRPILDAMQTMPSFVYLIPAIMFFGWERFRRCLPPSFTPFPR